MVTLLCTSIGKDGWPLRTAVEAAWREVIAGRRTRESVHDWSVPWVEGVDVDRPLDAMADASLLRLHGLDMTSHPETPNLVGHGGPGRYVLSDAEVAKRLEQWLGGCREYYEDPAGFAQRAGDEARGWR